MVKLIDDEALEKMLTIVDARHSIIDKDRKGDKIMEWIPCTDNKKVCKDCHYNDGGVHAECIVCDKAENRKEFGDVKRSDCFGCEDEATEDDSTIPAHWIDQGHKIFKCSNCGNYLDFRGVNAGRGTANYCPNCGAKMWNILTRKPQKNSQSVRKK